MSKFRKKPVVIDAIKWNGATIGLTNGGVPFSSERLEIPDWMPAVAAVYPEDYTVHRMDPGQVIRCGDALFIGTLEGAMRASPGDWIIRGVKGEIYPCEPDIFDATYDPVDAA